MTTAHAIPLPRPDVTIDPEFRDLLSPLTLEEVAILEEDILHHGIMSPLVVWDETGILLDGHHRHRIAEKHGLPYRVERLSFLSRDDAADWMDAHQLGRRNLTPDAASLLRGRRYNRLTKPNDGSRGNQFSREAGAKVAPASSERTAAALAKEHGVGERTIKRDGAFARSVDTLAKAVPDLPARVMAGTVPSRQVVHEAAREVEAAVQRKAPPAELKRVTEAAAAKVERPHVANNSGNNEWYTPPEFVDAARELLGGFDCDPATSVVANRTVRAERVHTAETDGRDKPWGTRVWLNPPYGQPLLGEFVDQLVKRVEAGEVRYACVLVNNATETAWFQRLLGTASAVCFPRGRIKFHAPEGGERNVPLQGQAIFYVGDQSNEFAAAFRAFGAVARLN